MAKQLTPDHRSRVAEKVMDWGNLVFAGLVVAEIVPGTGPFCLSTILLGVLSISGAHLFANFLIKGDA